MFNIQIHGFVFSKNPYTSEILIYLYIFPKFSVQC